MKNYNRMVAITLLAAMFVFIITGCAPKDSGPPTEPHAELSWFGRLFTSIDSTLGINNYAWSIMVFTLLLRVVLLPFDIAQKKSTRKQSALQPKLDAINEKYKNDKEKASQKTMELYKKEGVNMFAGCLPALLQLPLFFLFLGALRNVASFEMYEMYQTLLGGGEAQVQGWLWVRNIWQADSPLVSVIPTFESLTTMFEAFRNTTLTAEVYDGLVAPLVAQFQGYSNGWFILPVLAGGTSFLMNKITAPKQNKEKKAGNDTNAMTGKVMQWMFPIMSVYICATNNAVFALYWFTSNLLSIASFLVIDKILTMQEKKKAEAAIVS